MPPLRQPCRRRAPTILDPSSRRRIGTASDGGSGDDVGVVDPDPEPGDHLGRRGGVEREHHQRLAGLAIPRDGHVRDVHAGLAEERADPADHPGNVVVAEHDHAGRKLDLDLEPEHRDEPLAVVAADGRAGDALLARGHAIRFVKSREERLRCSTTSIPRSAATSGAFT